MTITATATTCPAFCDQVHTDDVHHGMACTINTDDPHTRVTVDIQHVPGRPATVDLAGMDLTPTQARALAAALTRRAGIAEQVAP